MIRIYQLIIQRRHVGHHSKPAERIDSFVLLHPVGRYTSATDAVISIAASDEITFNGVPYAAV